MPSDYEKNVGVLMYIPRWRYDYYDKAHCRNISFMAEKTYGGIKEGFDFYYAWVNPKEYQWMAWHDWKTCPPELYFGYIGEKA